MTVENIVERLGIQTQSLQEGFSILSRVRTLKDMAKQFCHILRGSILSVDVNLYFRPSGETEWQSLYLSTDAHATCTENIPESTALNVYFPADQNEKIIAVLPLIDGGRFALIIGDKLDKTAYSDFERISVQIFLQMLDSAYQTFLTRQREKNYVFSLNERVLQLNSLIDTGIEISSLQKQSQLRHLALERVIALTNASRGMLRVTEKNRVIDKLFFPSQFSYKTLEKDSNFIETRFNFQDNTYIFKLFNKESRQGYIDFDDTDQLLLDAFSRQLHAALENNFLHEEALEKQRIDQDIEVVGLIQQKILPDSLPVIEGYDLFGVNIPTKMVGGDYFDCIPLSNNRFALVIADVSGKGVPAALLVSSLHASLIAHLENNIPLSDLAQRLNKVIYNASTDDKYITFYLAILNPETGELESLNAGHNPIYLRRKDGTLSELKVGGIPFGMLGLEFPYTSETIHLKEGDCLLLYTDGVTEAMNADEEEYDDHRPLTEFFLKHHDKPASEFINDLMDDIQDFTGNTPQSDDITALYLKKI